MTARPQATSLPAQAAACERAGEVWEHSPQDPWLENLPRPQSAPACSCTTDTQAGFCTRACSRDQPCADLAAGELPAHHPV